MILLKSIKSQKNQGFSWRSRAYIGTMIRVDVNICLLFTPKSTSLLISSSVHSFLTALWTFLSERPEPWVSLSLIAVYCISFISLLWRDGAITGTVDIIPAFYSQWRFCSIWVSSKWPLGLPHSVATRAKNAPSSFLFFLFLPVPPLNSQT